MFGYPLPDMKQELMEALAKGLRNGVTTVEAVGMLQVLSNGLLNDTIDFDAEESD
jgi:hypothetical protein